MKRGQSLRVGLCGTSLDAYWPQFEGLCKRLEKYVAQVGARIARAGVEVVNLGLVDSPERSREAGHQCRRGDIDVLFLYVTTYALSDTVLPLVQRAGVPVVVLNLQPEATIDYNAFNRLEDRTAMTCHWLAYCSACPIPEIANVMARARIPFHQVTGVIDNEETWRDIEGWLAGARVTYGRASFDRTNDLNVSPIYYLPFGPGKRFARSNNIFNRELVGGWELEGLQCFGSGQSFTINTNSNADTSPNHSVYANITCNPMDWFQRTRFHIYNASCFAQPAAGHYGTARSVGSQPGVFDTNPSLLKDFARSLSINSFRSGWRRTTSSTIRSSVPPATVSRLARSAWQLGNQTAFDPCNSHCGFPSSSDHKCAAETAVSCTEEFILTDRIKL
ncbi:MAG: hypothetical protein P4K86_09610 [Terracidiphilus sp.]|nr:hypothetical protein [Terracidiphilus sp.]